MYGRFRRWLAERKETPAEREADAEAGDDRESERLEREADAARYAGGTSIQGRGGGTGRGF